MKKLDKVSCKRTQISLAGGIVFLVLLFIDQLSKMLAFVGLNLNGEKVVPLIPNLIWFAYTENDAIAFGIGSGNQTFMIVVTVLTVFMIGAIAALYFTLFKKNTPVRMCLAVIESGAVGNLIDRLFVRGTMPRTLGLPVVRDFVDVSKLGFGICNIADFCITFGAVALVFCILFIGKTALFPLTKKWREQAKKEENGAKEHKKNRKNGKGS